MNYSFGNEVVPLKLAFFLYTTIPMFRVVSEIRKLTTQNNSPCMKGAQIGKQLAFQHKISFCYVNKYQKDIRMFRRLVSRR